MCTFKYEHASITTSAPTRERHELGPGKAAAVQKGELGQRRDRVDRATEAVGVPSPITVDAQIPVRRRLSGMGR